MWYIPTMEYYLVVKKNESESVLVRQMNLELVIQSEVSQKEKHKIQDINAHIWNLKNGAEEIYLQGRNGDEFEQTLRVGDGQGGLACCGPWGCEELDMTE